MIAQAKGSYLRVSPMKTKLVIDLIRGKDVLEALNILMHVNKSVTKTLTKILNSAISNAKQKGLAEDQLYISKIYANPGATWKRFRAVAFGRATGILKRTAHITIELDLKTK
jgi:large subunit ribosomal protein L22